MIFKPKRGVRSHDEEKKQLITKIASKKKKGKQVELLWEVFIFVTLKVVVNILSKAFSFITKFTI